MPAADIREDFSASLGLHGLSLYEAMPWLVSPGLSLAWFGRACAANLLTTIPPAAHMSPVTWWSEDKPKRGPPLCQPAVSAWPYRFSQAPPTIAFVRLFAAKRAEAFMHSLRDVLADAVVVGRERSAASMHGAGVEGWRPPPEAAAFERAWGPTGAGTLPAAPPPVPWFSHEWRIVTREEAPVYAAAGWQVSGGGGGRKEGRLLLPLLAAAAAAPSDTAAASSRPLRLPQTVLSPASLPKHMNAARYFREAGVAHEYQAAGTSALRPSLTAASYAESTTLDPLTPQEFAGGRWRGRAGARSEAPPCAFLSPHPAAAAAAPAPAPAADAVRVFTRNVGELFTATKGTHEGTGRFAENVVSWLAARAPPAPRYHPATAAQWPAPGSHKNRAPGHGKAGAARGEGGGRAREN